jgi:hypothetical protein
MRARVRTTPDSHPQSLVLGRDARPYQTTPTTGTAAVAELHIGECVTFRDRAYIVRGVSPMSAIPCRVYLEDGETGEEIEADAADLEGERSQSG